MMLILYDAVYVMDTGISKPGRWVMTHIGASLYPTPLISDAIIDFFLKPNKHNTSNT